MSDSSLWKFLGIAGLQLTAYAAAYVAARGLRSPRSVFGVIALAVLSLLPLLLTYPGAAGDVYAYVAEADLILRYGANPFLVPVSSFPTHPLLPFLDFPAETTHYGPLWLVIATVMRAIAGDGLLAGIVTFKIASVVFLQATALVVYLTLRRTAPSAAVSGALLVAWNPLLAFETAQNAHNDVAMSLLVALAFYFRARDSFWPAFASLLLACMVKYIAIVLVPIFLLAEVRRGARLHFGAMRAAGAAVGAAVLAVVLVGIVGIEGTVGVLQKMSTEWFTTSAGAAAYYELAKGNSQREAATMVANSTRALYILVYILGLASLWQRPASVAGHSLWAMLSFMAIPTVWFQPWYVAWAVPIAALVASAPARGALLGMTAGGFATYAIMGFGWRLEWNHGDLVWIHAAGALAMWVPVLLGLAIPWLLGFGRQRRGPAEAAPLRDMKAAGRAEP